MVGVLTSAVPLARVQNPGSFFSGLGFSNKNSGSFTFLVCSGYSLLEPGFSVFAAGVLGYSLSMFALLRSGTPGAAVRGSPLGRGRVSGTLGLHGIGVRKTPRSFCRQKWSFGVVFGHVGGLGAPEAFLEPKINHFSCILRRLEDQGAQMRNQGSHL